MRRWAIAAGFVLLFLSLVLINDTVTVVQDWRYPWPASVRSTGDAAAQATRARMVNAVIPDAVTELGYDQPLLVIPEDMQGLLGREPDMFGEREQETVDRGLVHPFVAGRAVVRAYDAGLTRSKHDELEEMAIVEFPHEVYAVTDGAGSRVDEGDEDREVFLFVAPDGIGIYVVPDEVASDLGLLP